MARTLAPIFAGTVADHMKRKRRIGEDVFYMPHRLSVILIKEPFVDKNLYINLRYALQ